MRFILMLAAAVGPLMCGAQLPDTLFLHFPAGDYPVRRGEMPEVSYTERLTNDCSLSAADFSVRLEYPEYQALTAAEAAIVKAEGRPFGSEVTPECLLTHFRRTPQLEVTFCPLVCREGRYMRLTSGKIVISQRNGNRAKAKAADASERYADHSVLSKGKWVKISVSEEGMYELTAKQLQEMGFSDIKRVKLYGYGGRILDEVLTRGSGDGTLCEVPLHRNASSLLFYADGTVRWDFDSRNKVYTHTDNYYSRFGYYFLTEGDSPLTLGETDSGSADMTLTEVPGHALYDGNTFMWYEGGRRLFDSHDFASGRQHAFRLDAPGAVGGEDARLVVAMSAASALSATPYSVAVNNVSVGASLSVPSYGSNESARVASATLKPGNIAANNTVQITTGNTNNARLDFLRLTYTRQLEGTAVPFSFVTGVTEPAAISISGADAGTEVWELPHGTTPLRRVKATLSGTTLTTTALEPDVRYALVNTRRNYPAPTLVGEIENQDLLSDEATDMVIVIPASGKLAAQAERLAQIHREKDGLRVRVVRADKIYNEFSSGTPDAGAVRRYMKMLYDRAETEADMPRFLLLFGNGLADNRMLTAAHSNKNPDDYLLCYEKDNSELSIGELQSYCTDDFYGMLDDGEGQNILSDKLDLGIGRFCCTTEEEARILVDKVERYLANKEAGIWKNDVLLMGDYGDANSHMDDAERVATAITAANPDMNIVKVYPDAYTWTTTATGHSFPQATQRMEEALSSGVALVDYSGHGSPNQISHAWLTSTAGLSRISSTRLPLWLLASCEIYPIDSEEENIGHMSMLKEDGGAIGFISATRSVYASYNNPLNRLVAGYLLAKKPDGSRYTFGEALMMGKCDMVSKRTDMTMNKMKYVLVGDPALTLATPDGKVVLDSIDGTAVGDSRLTLKAGSIVRLSGHIEGHTDYNGLLSLRIYDREQTVTCKNNAKDDINKPYTYQTLGGCVFSGTCPIKDGHFTATASIPLDISYVDDAARISLYAVDSLYTNEASGLFTDFCLNGTASDAVGDTIPPTAFMYVGEVDFPNGGTVPSDFLLEAVVSDNYGLNAAGSGLGHDMSLVIDGDAAHAASLNEYFAYDFGTHLAGHIAYPMTGLTPGLHNLALRVWDINNNSTLTEMAVLVQANPSTDFSVSTTANPVTTATQLVVTLPQTHSAEPVALRIYAATGQLLWEQTLPVAEGQHFVSAPWRACSSAGTPLPSGVYLLRAEQGKQHTKTKKIIIHKQ